MFSPDQRHWLQDAQPLRPTVRSVLASNPRGVIGGLLFGTVVVLLFLAMLVMS